MKLAARTAIVGLLSITIAFNGTCGACLAQSNLAQSNLTQSSGQTNLIAQSLSNSPLYKAQPTQAPQGSSATAGNAGKYPLVGDAIAKYHLVPQLVGDGQTTESCTLQLTDPATGKTTSAHLNTVCAGKKSQHAPPTAEKSKAQNLTWTVTDTPPGNTMQVVQAAKTLASQGAYDKIPLTPEKRLQTVMQTTIWKEMAGKQPEEKDAITHETFKQDLLQKSHVDPAKMTPDQDQVVDNIVAGIFSSVDITTKLAQATPPPPKKNDKQNPPPVMPPVIAGGGCGGGQPINDKQNPPPIMPPVIAGGGCGGGQPINQAATPAQMPGTQTSPTNACEEPMSGMNNCCYIPTGTTFIPSDDKNQTMVCTDDAVMPCPILTQSAIQCDNVQEKPKREPTDAHMTAVHKKLDFWNSRATARANIIAVFQKSIDGLIERSKTSKAPANEQEDISVFLETAIDLLMDNEWDSLYEQYRLKEPLKDLDASRWDKSDKTYKEHQDKKNKAR